MAIGSIEMKDVLFKVVEVDKPSLLTDLLRGMEDVNIRLEDGGQALLHRAAEKGTHLLLSVQYLYNCIACKSFNDITIDLGTILDGCSE